MSDPQEEMVKKASRIRTVDLILCGLFAALIAVGAFIKIPVPNMPFTLQVLFTTLAGLLLGSKLGAISVAVYVAIGLAGVPIFTGGGGIGYVVQPTFGYLIGFLVGTFVTGLLVEKAKNPYTPSVKRLLVASFAGLAIVYAFGMVYYYCIMNFYTQSPFGIGALFLYCFALSIPGDIALCIGCSFLGKRLIPILKRDRNWKG